MPALVLRPFLAVVAAAPQRRMAARGRSRSVDEAPLDPREARRFRELFLPHLDACYRFARFLARDAAIAEDLAQDTFLAAFRAFRGYRGGDPKAWLFAILRSQFLQQVRRGGPWTEVDEAVEEAPDPAVGPEGALLQADSDAAVRAAIEALPDPFREAIVLRELEELSYREIAEITTVPIGTVMSRLARARRMLAATLIGEDAP